MARTSTRSSPSQSPSRRPHGVPINIDIHIPLVLLGAVKIDEQFTTDLNRYENRLNLLYDGLVGSLNECKIPLVLWEVSSLPDRLSGAETDDERRAIKTSREAWKQAEGEKKALAIQSDAWVLRATPKREKEEAVGVQEGWREGDGLLTEKEDRLAYDARVWRLEFTLQRYSLELEKRNEWEKEIKAVMEILAKISRLGQPDKRLLSVFASERCHPQITFQQSSSTGEKADSWDEDAVYNLLLLMTAFERELGTMTTPEFLLRYRPLTDFLTRREVRKMHREKKRILRGFWQEMFGDKKVGGDGQLRKQRRWHRKCQLWLENVKYDEKEAQRRDAFLGEEGQAWWEEIHKVMTEAEVVALVEDIVRSTAEGRGLQIALSTMMTPLEENYDSTPSNVGEIAGTTTGTSANSNEATESTPRQLSLPPEDPPVDPFPPITSISFPIPCRGLDASPLLTYIDLLIHILHHAFNNSKDDIISFLDAAKKDQKRAQDTPLEGLVGFAGFATKIGCMEERVKKLKAQVETYMQEGKSRYEWMNEENTGSDPFRKVERYVEMVYEEGRRAVVMRSGDVGQTPGADRGDEGKDVGDAKKDTKDGLETNNRSGKLLWGYLERYEQVNGFLVPSRMKALRLLEAKESAGDGVRSRTMTV